MRVLRYLGFSLSCTNDPSAYHSGATRCHPGSSRAGPGGRTALLLAAPPAPTQTEVLDTEITVADSAPGMIGEAGDADDNAGGGGGSGGRSQSIALAAAGDVAAEDAAAAFAAPAAALDSGLNYFSDGPGRHGLGELNLRLSMSSDNLPRAVGGAGGGAGRSSDRV